MLDFAEQTGAGGLAFDYTYFEGHESQYAQWAGWRAILRGLQRLKPRARARQPPAQPRVGAVDVGEIGLVRRATRLRRAAHQLDVLHSRPAHRPAVGPHSPAVGGVVVQERALCADGDHVGLRLPPDRPHAADGLDPVTSEFYTKDFDLLGHRYSLLSSIATGGLNNVLCDIPARNASEFDLFPAAARAWIKDSLTWTDDRRALRRRRRAHVRAGAGRRHRRRHVCVRREAKARCVAWLFNRRRGRCRSPRRSATRWDTTAVVPPLPPVDFDISRGASTARAAPPARRSHSSTRAPASSMAASAAAGGVGAGASSSTLRSSTCRS